MSFSFSFSGDDIHNEPDTDANLASKLKDSSFEAPLQQDSIPPKLHTLEELLDSLPSQISYNYLCIPKNVSHSQNDGGYPGIKIPRRSLFDIRQQLMVEVDPTLNGNDSLLHGLEQGDLSSGVYEGGFKTWECALDLANLVDEVTSFEEGLNVIELGAGSAIPSLVLLAQALRARMRIADQEKRKTWPEINVTLCDYNEDVLRLGTSVNVFLTTLLCGCSLERTKEIAEEQDDEDIDLENVDQEMTRRCAETLSSLGITCNFVSGSWGDDFLNTLKKTKVKGKTLTLASETIYSPSSTKVFSKLLMDILKLDKTNSKALVAAKKVYFGVGGDVQNFSGEIHKFGGEVKTVLDIKTSGVGRVVLQINAA